MHSTRREVMARLQEDCCYELRELCMLTTDQMIQVSFSFGFIQKDLLRLLPAAVDSNLFHFLHFGEVQVEIHSYDGAVDAVDGCHTLALFEDKE